MSVSDKSFKICNNWNSFHNDIENIKSNLIKNAYLPFSINNVIKKYFDYKETFNIKLVFKGTRKSVSAHPFTIASVPLAPFRLCFSFVIFCICLSSVVFTISTLIIGTFYCLNYTLLLLLYNTPWNRFYNNYVIDICLRQLLWLVEILLNLY